MSPTRTAPSPPTCGNWPESQGTQGAPRVSPSQQQQGLRAEQDCEPRFSHMHCHYCPSLILFNLHYPLEVIHTLHDPINLQFSKWYQRIFESRRADLGNVPRQKFEKLVTQSWRMLSCVIKLPLLQISTSMVYQFPHKLQQSRSTFWRPP